MKNFLLGFIAILLLGIFVFLGLIYFTEETDVTEVEKQSEVKADDDSSDESSEKDQESERKEETSREKADSEDVEDDTGTTPAVELEKELSQQDIVVDNVEYTIQDDRLKSLYPDMLSAIATNNTSIDIRDITYAYVAWDRNGLPLKIKGSIDFSDGQYVYGGKGGNVNVAPGETFGQEYGFEIDSKMDESIIP